MCAACVQPKVEAHPKYSAIAVTFPSGNLAATAILSVDDAYALINRMQGVLREVREREANSNIGTGP